jgi:hypothetical protein
MEPANGIGVVAIWSGLSDSSPTYFEKEIGVQGTFFLTKVAFLNPRKLSEDHGGLRLSSNSGSSCSIFISRVHDCASRFGGL